MGFTVNEWILAAGAGIAATWSTLRAWLDLLASLVWVRSELCWPTSAILLRHLHDHYTVSRMGSATYNTHREFVRPRGRFEAVAVEEAPARRVYRRGLAFIVVAGHRVDEGMTQRITVGHLRGMLDVPTLLVQAHDGFNDAHSGDAEQGSRYHVVRHYGAGRRRSLEGRGYSQDVAPSSRRAWEDTKDLWRPLKWRREDLGAMRTDAPFQGLAYPQSIEDAAESIRRWKASERFYRERRIPWRLGVLAHGQPGTGKTSFTRAIAQELDLPVHQFHLAGMDNEDLYDAWRDTTSDTPCVALFEDLDRVFVGQENRIEGSGLTLDALLNCISGVEPAEGVLTIVTANDPTRLDRALGVPESNGTSSRPGRLDMAVEFGEMAPAERDRLAEMILGDAAYLHQAVEDLSRLTTPAQVQAACAELALARLYEGGREG